MNTSTLVSRLDPRALPQWNGGAAGYSALQSGGGGSGQMNRQASRLASIARRYWWLAALIWAVVAIPASIAIYRYISPEYVAAGSINVAPVTVNVVNGQNQTTAFYTEYLRTQAELMKEPYVLQRAAEDIRLSRYEWFRQLSDQVGYLTKHVQVEPIPSTQNIQVSMTYKNAEAAKAIVDSVLDAYQRTSKDLEEKNVTDNLKILTKLQGDTSKDLKDAQDRLDKLTANGANMFSADDRKILADVLTSSKEAQARLQADQLSLQNKLDSLEARKLPEKETYVASVATDSDPQVNQWATELIRVQVADDVLASQHVTEVYPARAAYHKEIRSLTAQIAERKKQIQEARWAFYQADFELKRAEQVNQTQADLEGVSKQLAELQKRIAEQETAFSDLGSKMQPLLALQGQIDQYKDTLRQYTHRIEDIENQNQAPGRVAPVAPTVLPKTPTVDKRLSYIMASNGGGLLLGALALVLMMKLRDRIDHIEDLPEGFQPLVVGTVSHAGGAGASARSIQGQMRRKVLGEEMRLLHANLLPPGPIERRLMMITSPTPGNGKTSIASQLALSLAKSGLNVLLIDADLRKRDLSTLFDVGYRPGLVELLQGRPPELIQPVELLPNLKLMGAGTRLDRNPVELLQRRAFHESLNLLQEKFDCVVVDTPPALIVADARLIARSCDEILCVVRAQVSSPKEVNQTLDALTRITGKTPKIVVNGLAQRQSYYRHKYDYTNKDEKSDEPAAAESTS